MKCEHCGNHKVWVGSMVGGHLECEHCMNDDDYISPELAEAQYTPPKGVQQVTIQVCGGGGGGAGGSAQAQAGGGSGRSISVSGSNGQANPAPTKCPGCWNYVDECTCGVELKSRGCGNNCTAVGGDKDCDCYTTMKQHLKSYYSDYDFRTELDGEWKC